MGRQTSADHDPWRICSDAQLGRQSLMALDWDRLDTTEDRHPPIITIYGGEGLGKTTLASEFPAPYYVQTGKNERPPTGIEMPTRGLCEEYADIVNQIDWMLEDDHDRLTFVLDTLDSAEPLVVAEACARNGWSDISEGAFGAGGKAVASVWRELINKLIDLKHAGFAVVLLGHAKVKTDPGVTTDSYPRYRLNLSDDAGNAVSHASDIVGYIHQRVSIVKEKAGFHKDNVRKRGEGGGDRQIAIEERPGFVAKNRYRLSGTLPFKEGHGYEEIAKHIILPTGRQVAEPAE
ncbi:MAG: ATP-binding protein [Mesorhizobium sp.]|nr:MAG: ATP-binding protein [Mesorhizobium sp.]